MRERSLGEMWTLVRYAGPASKASIGSKPIGSELEGEVVLVVLLVNLQLTFAGVLSRTCVVPWALRSEMHSGTGVGAS